MEELYEFESNSASGPSVALSALIALAATIVTQGAATWLSTTMVTGAAVTTATATAVIGGMSSALVASLASRAASALANCNGDFGQAAKSLVSQDAFKDLGISMATAGVLEGMGPHLKLPTKAADCKSGLNHLKRVSLQMSINMAVSLGLGKPFVDALKQIGRTGIASMAQGMVANEIGQADLDTVTNKIAHGLVGGVAGILLQNSSDGFLSGASGAAVGAMIADAIQEDPKVTIQRIENQAKADGKDLRDEKVRKAYAQSEVESQRLVNWSILGAGIVGLLAKQNVHISTETARTAVESNCAQALAAAVAAGVLKKVSAEAVSAGVAAATAMVGGLLTKKQTEDHLNGTSKREMAPEDIDLKVPRFTQEASKPTVHVTPGNDYRPTDQGFEEAPIDLTRGTSEGYQAYDGPDTNILNAEFHILYGKPSKDDSLPTYIGRMRGDGNLTDPADIQKAIGGRDRNHHMNEKGFGRPYPIAVSEDYNAIRGLEQMTIDLMGGAIKQGETSSNTINEIAPTNPKLEQYLKAAEDLL